MKLGLTSPLMFDDGRQADCLARREGSRGQHESMLLSRQSRSPNVIRVEEHLQGSYMMSHVDRTCPARRPFGLPVGAADDRSFRTFWHAYGTADTGAHRCWPGHPETGNQAGCGRVIVP